MLGFTAWLQIPDQQSLLSMRGPTGLRAFARVLRDCWVREAAFFKALLYKLEKG